MPLWKHYHVAQSIKDALQALETAPAAARFIAGGTDLLMDLQQQRHAPVDLLVDVTRVPELTCLEVRSEQLFIGAAVPLRKIAGSSLVRHHALALVEACSLIGGPQVRNVATLGGNVAHALPAADGTIALLALNAIAEVADSVSCRQVALAELFSAPGKTTLRRNEMLVGFYLPLQDRNTASTFRRIMRPQGVALPVLNMGCWLRRSGDLLAEIRLAVGPSGPTPRRAINTEAFLAGHHLDEKTIKSALAILLGEVRLRTSPYRATMEYRQHLCAVLLAEVLNVAYFMAGESDVQRDG